MIIQEAAEMYLETIYGLSLDLEHVRSIDVAKKMGYSKPTVSIMMKDFRENGYIEMNEKGYITLTKRGLSVAKTMYQRHHTIAEILMEMGVDKKTAYEDSCKIEHDLSDQTFQCICDYFQKQPSKG
ncbi:MAG TPA: metal-dependent transcriptional regulator [Bacillota bacterium]|nr:metal-dependent transcriptional regulator [Bacillota bacterium]